LRQRREGRVTEWKEDAKVRHRERRGEGGRREKVESQSQIETVEEGGEISVKESETH